MTIASERTRLYGSSVTLRFRVPAAGSLGLGSLGPPAELVRIECHEPCVWLTQSAITTTGAIAGDTITVGFDLSFGLGQTSIKFSPNSTIAIPFDFNQQLVSAHSISGFCRGAVGDFAPSAADRDVAITVQVGAAPFSRLNPEADP
jgi:hypothetical protein